MSKKREGFILVESIISIPIIGISMYIIATTLQNSNGLVSCSNKKFEMLEIARKNIEYTKLHIENDEGIVYENNEKGYKIKTTIEEEKDYYNCYKIEVMVQSDYDSINLMSYVTKK